MWYAVKVKIRYIPPGIGSSGWTHHWNVIYLFICVSQNADDNSYPSEVGVVPALAFVVERDCITVLNNETGFQDGNIKAICDVGRSTKGKHKYGYIGEYVCGALKETRIVIGTLF